MQIPQTMLNIVETNPNITESITVLCLTALIYYGKKLLFEKVIKKIVDKTKTKFDNEIYPLVNRLLSLVIWFSGLIFILIKLGVNITGLVTTIGASSLIIAYGCKDTLSNIISGLVLMADRPFRVGDIIELPSKERVVVLNIGLRRSKFLESPDGDEPSKVVIVPNSDLAKSKMKNYTYAQELEKES